MFPPAAQPDIVRAHQKDEVYVRVRALFSRLSPPSAPPHPPLSDLLPPSTNHSSNHCQMLRDSVLDTARRFTNARRVVQYQDYFGVIATLWYHALTTGLGTQTLGEEYCDIYQTDSVGRFPRSTRRWTLVLLEAFIPSLLQRARTRAQSVEARGDIEAREQGSTFARSASAIPLSTDWPLAARARGSLLWSHLSHLTDTTLSYISPFH